MAAKHTKFYGVSVKPPDLIPDVAGPAGTPTFVPLRVEANPALVTAAADMFVLSDQAKPTPKVFFGMDPVGSRVGITGLRVAHAIYSFAADGGAISTITPVKTANIPANAIIWGGVVNPTTAPTGTAGALVSVGTSAGSSTTALLAAADIATMTIDVLLPMVPTLAVPIKLTAAGNITVSISVHALTAGIIELFVFYTVAANA